MNIKKKKNQTFLAPDDPLASIGGLGSILHPYVNNAPFLK